MAYSRTSTRGKRTASRGRSATRRSAAPRARKAASKRTKRAAPARRVTQQTVRVVLEMPSALSAAGITARPAPAPRRARF